MSIIEIPLRSEADTIAFAHGLATHLQPGDAVLLRGPLGAGKTAMARASILAMIGSVDGATAHVPSPSYTLVQTYESPRGDIWHADLFRIGAAEECLELGLDDAFETAICFVEWPGKLGEFKPLRHLEITLDLVEGDTDARVLTARACGSGWAWLAGVAASVGGA